MSYLFKEETYEIIGRCMEVHNNLGAGFLEMVYQDALEIEFNDLGYLFEREKEYEVNYKGKILPHRYYADFIVLDKIILEIKAVSKGFSDAHIAQVINYLKVSGEEVALLVNFGCKSLEYKRIVL